MGRLDGTDVAYLATRESHEYLRTISRVGRRLPAHAGALGKALLAERPGTWLPEAPYAALTPHTHTSHASLLADLAVTVSAGTRSTARRASPASSVSVSPSTTTCRPRTRSAARCPWPG